MQASELIHALTEQQAAHYISMSRSFLRQGRMNGLRENRTPTPPYYKIGRSVRYRKTDLDSWLEQFRQGGES
jgi:predicted DNA-binding transcriptional regulator AlpA